MIASWPCERDPTHAKQLPGNVVFFVFSELGPDRTFHHNGTYATLISIPFNPLRIRGRLTGWASVMGSRPAFLRARAIVPALGPVRGVVREAPGRDVIDAFSVSN